MNFSRNIVSGSFFYNKQRSNYGDLFCRFCLIALFFFFAAAAPAQSSTSNSINISFGKANRLNYKLDKGLLNIYHNQHEIISDAYAEVKASEKIYKTSEYGNVVYKKTVVNDAAGKGTRHQFISIRKGYPTITQVFYTYPGKEYILAEVMVSGNAINSNYIAQLISAQAAILDSADVRCLYVPFDNDTFISYNAKSTEPGVVNTSAEVGAVYDNTSRKGLVIGSLEQDVWKTGVRTAVKRNLLSELKVWSGFSEPAITRDSIPHGSISGSTVKSAKILIGYFDDWRAGLETYSKLIRTLNERYIFNWTKPVPFGWNSWGVLQDKITYDKVTAVADFFKDSLPGFRNENTIFIDLDAYWDFFLENGINGDDSKLKNFVHYCNSKGMQPGVYWAPFADWGWKANDSQNRKVEGSNTYTYGDIWTKTAGHFHNIDGARALDPTHPGTRQRIALYMRKFRSCGFKMIKIDFLGHAAIEADSFYDKTITTGMQAFKKGMEFLVDSAGNDMFVYTAISPNIATGRYTHSRRIACDAFKSISDTRYTLNSLNYGWWQTFIYNFIDADHIVFGSEMPGTNRARLTSGLIAGTLFTGDDFSTKGAWITTAKKLLQNQELLSIAKNGRAFMPLDGNTADTTNPVFYRRIGDNMYVAVINVTNESQEYNINLNRMDLQTNTMYSAIELYNGAALQLKNILHASLSGRDAAIYKINLRVK